MSAYPPRLLSEEDAARYMGVSKEQFRKRTPIRPVQNHPFGNRVLYDRAQLDKYADTLSGLRDDAAPMPKPSDAF